MPRLILLTLFLLISLLSICRAPQYHLWLLAVVVTEYPLIFASIAAILTAWGYWLIPYRSTGTWIGLISIVLFLSPVSRAWLLGHDLKKKMAMAFTGGGRPPVFPGQAPFSFGKLLSTTPGRSFETFTYAQYPELKLDLDLYRAVPAQQGGSAKAPCIIVIHGGSWSSGDSKQLPELNWHLSARGYHVAAINYRKAPKYQTPAPVADVKQAIAYLSAHADQLDIDTNRFILLGRSAGAQIALLAAYTLHDARIKGVIDFYGPADMVWGYSLPSNPLIMDSRKVMRNYIGGPYEQVPDKYAACSPLEFVNDDVVPTLIIHGDNDVLVSPEHSRRLDQKLAQHNIRHFRLTLPWATHGFDYNLNGPGGQLSTYAVDTFLNTITQQ